MKKGKYRNNRTIQTVMQGFLLLVILSALFTVAVNLAYGLMITDPVFRDAALQSMEASVENPEGTGNPETPDQESLDQMRPEESTLALRPAAIVFYAAFALLFLLMALSTAGEWKVNRLRYGICMLPFFACVLVFVLVPDEMAACGWAAALHAVALITDHIFSIVKDHRSRNVVSRILAVIVLVLLLVLVFLDLPFIPLLLLMFVTIPRVFFYIAKIAFSRVKLDVLRKIVRNTYAAEILFGMLLLMIAFSIVLPQVESGIPTFADALWYCFAIVTTIGFGDYAAVTLPGRIVSVVLGIYGIIVVALITSIIVNFYNETKASAEKKTQEEEDPGDSRPPEASA